MKRIAILTCLKACQICTGAACSFGLGIIDSRKILHCTNKIAPMLLSLS